MRHRDTSFGLLLRDQAPERKLPAIAPERNVGVGRKILSENLSTNSIRCSLFCQEVSEQWLVIPGRRCDRRPRMYANSFFFPPLSYRRHHCFRTHASARCTFVRSRLRARASALTQAHNARAYAHDYARACLAPDGQANFENSCVCFIRKPLRTPEMASFLAPGFPLVRNLIRLV